MMTEAAPHALHKLTVGLMFVDATPVVKMILIGMLIIAVASLVILLTGLPRPSRGSVRVVRFLETAMVATPILALLGAAWGLITIFLGIANTNVANMAVAAPGVAEAILSVAVGLLALLFAVMAHRVVKPQNA